MSSPDKVTPTPQPGFNHSIDEQTDPVQAWPSAVNRLPLQICFVVIFAAWPTAWAQQIEWPAAPERTVWLAAKHGAFGNGQVASMPIDASTATKLGQAIERLAREQGYYGDGLVLRFLPGEYETNGIRVRPPL